MELIRLMLHTRGSRRLAAILGMFASLTFLSESWRKADILKGSISVRPNIHGQGRGI